MGRRVGTAWRSSPAAPSRWRPAAACRAIPTTCTAATLEAAIGGIIVGCLYLPNGNPAPGPKLDYKLRWFKRLTSYAKTLLESGAPAVLAGDFNVMPTDLDVYAPERWVDDALFRPEVRDAYRYLVAQGWTDALRALHPAERIYTFWKYFRLSESSCCSTLWVVNPWSKSAISHATTFHLRVKSLGFASTINLPFSAELQALFARQRLRNAGVQLDT
jgi:hypothetical protein